MLRNRVDYCIGGKVDDPKFAVLAILTIADVGERIGRRGSADPK
jgi:hypothetical protein